MQLFSQISHISSSQQAPTLRIPPCAASRAHHHEGSFHLKALEQLQHFFGKFLCFLPMHEGLLLLMFQILPKMPPSQAFHSHLIRNVLLINFIYYLLQSTYYNFHYFFLKPTLTMFINAM